MLENRKRETKKIFSLKHYTELLFIVLLLLLKLVNLYVQYLR